MNINESDLMSLKSLFTQSIESKYRIVLTDLVLPSNISELKEKNLKAFEGFVIIEFEYWNEFKVSQKYSEVLREKIIPLSCCNLAS